jgi:hypothetical protein
MLQLLSANGVEFLVVGAYAMGVYGFVRATGDIDIWIAVSAENSEKVYKTLEQFGAPLNEIRRDTFVKKGIVFQIGVAPRRIDIITQIDGVDFADAYQKRFEVELGDIKIPFISMPDLIKNKETTGRDKDRLDAQQLRLSENEKK